MIAKDQELLVTMERISWLQQQVAHLRKTTADVRTCRAAASGFLTEVDRMQRDVQDYFRRTQPGTDAEPGIGSKDDRVVGVS